MPASTSITVYIAEETAEIINNFHIQKGLTCDGEPQRINFTYFIPEIELTEDESDAQSFGEALYYRAIKYI